MLSVGNASPLAAEDWVVLSFHVGRNILGTFMALFSSVWESEETLLCKQTYLQHHLNMQAGLGSLCFTQPPVPTQTRFKAQSLTGTFSSISEKKKKKTA